MGVNGNGLHDAKLVRCSDGIGGIAVFILH